MTEPGACADPSCPVLHADPANPIHPPDYEPGGPMWDTPTPPAFDHQVWRLPRAVWLFPGFADHEPAVALADNFGNGLVGFRPRRSLDYFRMSIKVWWKP